MPRDIDVQITWSVQAKQVSAKCSSGRKAERHAAKKESDQRILELADKAITSLCREGQNPTRRKIVTGLEKYGVRDDRQTYPLIRRAQLIAVAGKNIDTT